MAAGDVSSSLRRLFRIRAMSVLCLACLLISFSGCRRSESLSIDTTSLASTPYQFSGDSEGISHTETPSQENGLQLTITPSISEETTTVTPVITRYAMESGEFLFDVDKTVQAAVWSSDSEYLYAAIKDNGLVILRAKEKYLLGTEGTTTNILTLAVHQDNGYMAIASGEDNSIQLVSNDTGMPDRTFSPSHTNKPKKLVFNKEGNRLVSCGLDGKIYLWDVQTGALLQTLFEGSNCSDLVFSQSGLILVAGFGDEKVIRIWNTQTWEMFFSFPVESMQDIDINPNGTRIVTVAGTDSPAAHIWNLYTGNLLLTLSNQETSFWSVAYSSDGRFIATAGSSKSVYIWNAQTGELVYELETGQEFIRTLLYSPDGTMLAAAGNSIRIWYLTELGLASSSE